MNEHYFLEAKVVVDDGITKYGRFHLSSNINSDIRIYSFEESRMIRKHAKERHIIKKNKYKNEIYIDDQSFIGIVERNYPTKKKGKRKKKKHYFRSLIIGAAILSSLGVGINRINKNNIDNVIETNYEEDNSIKKEDIIIEERTEEPKQEEKRYQYGEPTLNDVGSTMVFNQVDNYDDVYKFNYEDRSDSYESNLVDTNYKNDIELTSSINGIDPILSSSIAKQENPTDIKNYDIYAGHGIFQIEGIWNGEDIRSYNQETKEYETESNIDVYKCVDDPEYCSMIFGKIFSNQYNLIYDNYKDKYSDSEILGISIFSYNKGITITLEAINNTNTYQEFLDYMKNNSYGGDNEYIEHVLSYVPDETVIVMKTTDGKEHRICIDNETKENLTKQEETKKTNVF